jgi:hypothetical protein
MATSTFLAKLIGPIMLVVGVAVFVNAAVFRAMADEFLRNRALMYLSGLLIMPVGIAIILTHNVWVAGWPVLITVLGWLMAIGGAIRILIPDKLEPIGRNLLKTPMMTPIVGGIWLAIGAIFCFFGYVR